MLRASQTTPGFAWGVGLDPLEADFDFWEGEVYPALARHRSSVSHPLLSGWGPPAGDTRGHKARPETPAAIKPARRHPRHPRP
eukprot:177483-Prorocentrum_minimum.AAC.6